jgi:ELWxxDGT repeat protein
MRKLLIVAAAALGSLGFPAAAAQADDLQRLTSNDGDPQISTPSQLTDAGGTLFFVAAEVGSGAELWKSDGTAGGTQLVKDINPGSAPSGVSGLTVVGGNVYFRANDGVNGVELWRSDGTSAGTQLVDDLHSGPGGSHPSALADVDGVLYFAADNGVNGPEPWRYDPSGGGDPLPLGDLSASGGSSPVNFTGLGDAVIFAAGAPGIGFELWRTDGTAPGTVLLKDINPGALSSTPAWFADGLGTLNGELLFSANDGTNGVEPWKTDGTAEGTVLVADIRPGPVSSLPVGFIELGGHSYFAANDGVHGVEPWKTDGTPAGTTMLKDINPSGPSAPFGRVIHGGVNLFSANDGTNGTELWRSDGTTAGTTLVKDIDPTPGVGGLLSLFPHVNVAGIWYFPANDGTNGRELWKSDGTGAGTELVADINATGDSNPLELVAIDGTIYFTADDGGGLGRQLWSFTPPTPDEDGDGVANGIDSGEGAFDDGDGTTGSIVDAAGLEVMITDEEAPEGVRIVVGPGAGRASFSICGLSTRLAAGSEMVITCGSIIVRALQGEAEITAGNGSAVISIPAGGAAEVTDNGDGGFRVDNLGDEPVTMTVDGEEETVEPGGSTVVEPPPEDPGDPGDPDPGDPGDPDPGDPGDPDPGDPGDPGPGNGGPVTTPGGAELPATLPVLPPRAKRNLKPRAKKLKCKKGFRLKKVRPKAKGKKGRAKLKCVKKKKVKKRKRGKRLVSGRR